MNRKLPKEGKADLLKEDKKLLRKIREMQRGLYKEYEIPGLEEEIED